MKLSHVLYKVKHLKRAVDKFRKMGFEVEYGKKENPYNALIYFSEGAYLELFESSGMPSTAKVLFRLFGKGGFVKRLDYFDRASEGLLDISIENNKTHFYEEQKILDTYSKKYFIIRSKRIDTKDRRLQMKCLFPYDLSIPFLMNYFNIDPKPKNFIHPNGVKKIRSIGLKTNEMGHVITKKLMETNEIILKNTG
ncbi:MAG: VOC family protein [Thermotogota bacterium]|nr:VOC family protein [Thermotogota bacterium]